MLEHHNNMILLFSDEELQHMRSEFFSNTAVDDAVDRWVDDQEQMVEVQEHIECHGDVM